MHDMHHADPGDNRLSATGSVTPAVDSPLDLVWGASNIALVIGRTPRQCYEALVKGELPARRVNRRWVASRKALERFFSGEAA